MATAAVSGVPNNAYTQAPADTSGVSGSSTLDKNGFLKMLTEQIKNQDPDSNQDPNQYFQTISQMTEVEQMTNLAAQSSTQLAQQKASDAMGLLGKSVSYVNAQGAAVSGTVDGIDLSSPDDGPLLSVSGQGGIDMGALLTVKQ